MNTLGTVPIHGRSAVREARRKILKLADALGVDEISATRLAAATSEIGRHMTPTADVPDPRLVVRLAHSPSGLRICLDFHDDNVANVAQRIINLTDGTSHLPAGQPGVRAFSRTLSIPPPSPAMLAKCESIIMEKGRELLMSELTSTNRELEASFERLRREKSDKQRMESELNIGRDIQRNLLPLVFPPFPERSEFDIFATLQPAREVGGDFYDFYLVSEDHLCIVIGDVSGKGVPAALFAAVTKTLLKSRGAMDPSPASIVTHANEELEHGNENAMFVTLWLGILHIPSGRMLYTNGGHNPPYVLRSDGSTEVLKRRHGPVVGAMDGLAYREDEFTLQPGDVLFLFTDGVTEAMNTDRALYGDDRLVALLGGLSSHAVRAVADDVIDDVMRYAGAAEQADDITLLCLSYAGASLAQSATLSVELQNDLSEIGRIRTLVATFLSERQVVKRSQGRLFMVLDELLSNSIMYGYDDSEAHPIGLRIDHRANFVVCTISDDGKPFNPLEIAAPDTSASLEERVVGGLGIHLVRQMMNEVSYRRVVERNEVRIVMEVETQTP
ncbi:MAG: SpoIIE family protein phosphatase [Myxococcales bacterium]|nr:SpoIIE family protein phosphatase [Myxococcales bacterium]